MTQEDIFCRDASLAAGEPLHGTAAADTDLWVILEVKESWGPKGPEDSGLPAELVKHLNDFGSAHPRARVQLIRKPERHGAGCVVYLGLSHEQDACVFRRELKSALGLIDVDLAGFAERRIPPGFVRVDEAVYLVCVHGKRDRCCAQRGMPLYTALSALSPEHTWQTTHLGGHRFAATMLVLPEGISYGRVLDSEASAIVAAHSKSELHDLERLRGRTCYAPAVQAADYFLRKQLGAHGLAALTFVSSTDEGPQTSVTFRDVEGGEHTLRVDRQPLASIPASCGAQPKSVDQFVPLRLP